MRNSPSPTGGADERRTSRSTRKLVIGLIVAGDRRLRALLLLLAYGGGSTPRPRRRARHALSVSAVGFKGIVDAGRRISARPASSASPPRSCSEDLLVVALEDREPRRRSSPACSSGAARPRDPDRPAQMGDHARPAAPRLGPRARPGAGAAAAPQIGKGAAVRVARRQAARPRCAPGADLLDGLQRAGARTRRR